MSKRIKSSIIWLLSTLFVIYAFSFSTTPFGISDPIKSSLDSPDLGITGAIALFIGVAGIQISSGYLLDYYNRPYILPIAILFLTLGNTLISYSSSMYNSWLANLIQGIGASFDFMTIVSVIFSNHYKKLSLNKNTTVVFLLNIILLLVPYYFITQSSISFFALLCVLPFCILVAILLTYFINENYCQEKMWHKESRIGGYDELF